MDSTTMTVTRALAELKLLDARITSSIAKAKFVDVYKKKDGKTASFKTVEECEKEIKADFNSISDLIVRRDSIKKSVLMSNATTKITIGGKEYTVVEALDKKDSIKYTQEMLNKMKRSYTESLSLRNNTQASLEQQVNNMINTNLGSATKATDNDYDTIAKPFIDANQINLIDPLKLGDKIDEIEKGIMEFESEVDFTLSESNAKTEISF